MKDVIIFIVGLFLAFIFAYYVVLFPIRLAEAKKIKGNDLTLIKVLTWLSFISGVTWFIALFWVIYYKKQK